MGQHSWALMEWIMWWTGSNKITSICHTICEMQIACKFIDMSKIDCSARKNECTQPLLALHANNWLNGRVFHNSRIFLQKININDRIRLKTAQYCRFVSKLWTSLSVHGDAEQEVALHPFPPALPLVCGASVCPSISVSVLSTTNCTVGLPPWF